MIEVTYYIQFTVDMRAFGDFTKEVRQKLKVSSDYDAKSQFKIFMRSWPNMFDGKPYFYRPKLVKEITLETG